MARFGTIWHDPQDGWSGGVLVALFDHRVLMGVGFGVSISGGAVWVDGNDAVRREGGRILRIADLGVWRAFLGIGTGRDAVDPARQATTTGSMEDGKAGRKVRGMKVRGITLKMHFSIPLTVIPLTLPWI
jgi:hypothetical protein